MTPRESPRRSTSRSPARSKRGRAPARSPRPVAPAPSRTRSRPPASIERILATQDWKGLAAVIESAGGEPALALERLKHLTRELLQWNRSASNLISGADEARVVERHVMESLAPAQWMRASGLSRWMDLGSGGGFPALPLAICGVGEHWTLVESRRTKTLFIRKSIQDMGLKNITVVNDRIENLHESAELAGQFDGFTSRATMKLAPTLESATHFVRIGGEAFLWKGSGRDAEMQEDTAWRVSWRLDGVRTIGSGLAAVCRFIRVK